MLYDDLQSQTVYNARLQFMQYCEESFNVLQEYELENCCQYQERHVLRAAMGSEYFHGGSSTDNMHSLEVLSKEGNKFEGPAVSCASSQGSCMVASGRENGTIVLWRKDCQYSIATLSGAICIIYHIASKLQHQVYFILAKYSGHTGSINDVCWSPSVPGLLISASDDRTVRMWYSQ